MRFVLSLLVSLGWACGEAPPTGGVAAFGLEDLVLGLRNAGATVSLKEEVSQPFFSPAGRLIEVNALDVQAFEYRDESAAKAEGERVSPDGGIVGTTAMMWVEPPHFFRRGRLIVLFVGEDPGVRGALEKVLGPQFAGR